MAQLSVHQLASSPFDDPKADLFIRTSDSVLFHVYGIILAQASPIFSDMLSMPRPPPEHASEDDYIDGNPVISLTEQSQILDQFLRCCYPIPSPNIDSSSFVALYQAGDKYQADVVKHEALKGFAKFSKLPDQCLTAFVDACRLGLRREATEAAKATLQLPRNKLAHAKQLGKFDTIPVSDYEKLVQFHVKCRNRISHIIDIEWCINKYQRERPPMWDLQDRSWNCCGDGEYHTMGPRSARDELGEEGEEGEEWVDYSVKLWCMHYLSDLYQATHRDDMPILDSVNDPRVLERAVQSAYKCTHCRPGAIEQLAQLTIDIREAVSCVPNKLEYALDDDNPVILAYQSYLDKIELLLSSNGQDAA
ncbi:hypothetical protein EIP86_005295 [Pleurotus ostreatoroseus]|nr:hypothetical protein EIP86_005295 [Pleurotus ostreatoroseus]